MRAPSDEIRRNLKMQRQVRFKLNRPPKTSNRRFGLIMAVAVVINALAVSFAAAWGSAERVGIAHPNHFSSAEVRWNEKTGKFEVALSVWPADLEKLLTLLAGKSIDLDKPEGLDVLMAGYVADKFRIRKVLTGEAESPQDLPKSEGEVADVQSEMDQDASPKDTQEKELSDPTVPAVKKGSPTEVAAVPAPEPQDSETVSPKPAAEENSVRRTLLHKHDAESQNPSETNPADWAERFKPTIAEKLPDGFRWVGFESNLKEAWLYFELAGDLEPATWEIENRIFFEFNEEQVNQIRFSDGKQTRSYSLKINQPRWQFSTERKEARGKSSEPSR